MKKTKFQLVEVFPEPTPEDVVAIAMVDPDNLPEDLKLPSRAWLMKRLRKLKAYESIWNAAYSAYEADDRDSAYFILKEVTDPADFMLYLIEYCTQPTNTSKAGGEAKNAILSPFRNQAKRLYAEKKLEHQSKGKSYSQKRFAKWFRSVLTEQHEAATIESKELRDQIAEFGRQIAQGGLAASELKLLRESKRSLQDQLRAIAPVLPSEDTISKWLSGL
jgi:hypothetical protein